MKNIYKIYVDTSVFGGVFDSEFSKPSKLFFNEIDAGKFELVTSAIVEAEIEPAPKSIRQFFLEQIKIAHIADITEEALTLRSEYINAGVVSKKSLDDALHVAIATISGCDLIVSWNFKHIVHFEKIMKYNAVNVLNGYRHIRIHSPLEVINYDE
jgi:predicted nucleic acid-binding protein